ncbi:MAG: sigma-70 family RNA polymerase sigma factor [Clostridia bacterium]|nr:sigma-70 family RNA polymerase sigma factor [Clostridia bacterium]
MLEERARRNEKIEENLGLVHACAARFRGRGVEYDDLFQAGCVGLCKAADCFDPDRGFAFSTYAVPMILGEIRRIFRDGGTVKIGRSVKERARRLLLLQQTLETELGRAPTISELSSRAACDPAQTAFLLSSAQPVLSLSAFEEDRGQQDIPVSSEDRTVDDKVSLSQALQSLDDKEKLLIELRFFRGMTQTKASQILGVSQVQVSRREKTILQKLRVQLNTD